MRTQIINFGILVVCLIFPTFANGQHLDVKLAKAGTLADHIPDMGNITSLKISGPLNGTDLRTIHEMCGMDYEHNVTQGHLETLDLNDARIEKGGKSYYKDPETGTACYTSNDILGKSALEGCFSLTSVTLPKDLKDVGTRAFASCPLTEIRIDEANEWLVTVNGVLYTKDLSIMKGFPAERFQASETFSAPEGLKEIPEYCMMLGQMGCLILPSTVETIGSQAIFFCTNLKKAVLPLALKSFSSDAFMSCTELCELQLDSACENFTVKESVLYDKNLSTLYLYPPDLAGVCFTVPSGISVIEPYSFAFNKHLTSVILPSSLRSIGTAVFAACEKLGEMSIPDGITALPDYLFANCSALKKVFLHTEITELGNWIFDECSELTEIDLPSGITSLPEGLFSNCSSLSSVTIPDGVTEIGNSAFNGCGITAIDIPKCVKRIGSYVFMNCKSLSSVRIPEGVTELPYASFMWCAALNDISLPSSLAELGDYVFVGCENLQSIHCFSDMPPVCGNSVFFKANDKADLYVPEEAVDIYKADPNWSTFHISAMSGIKNVFNNQALSVPAYYNLNGCRIPDPQPGLNIIVDTNGVSHVIIRK